MSIDTCVCCGEYMPEGRKDSRSPVQNIRKGECIMSKRGGNREGYAGNEYYVERIQKLCGTKRLKYNFLNSLTCKQLTEIIWLLELAQIHALDEKR